ncbi:2-polyprenyl-6-methoxyphenol hydroxylase [Belliella marina]|uniref:2-polyprenyl-6-methoxyphenol hydroxylase n=1 Tax=Belliella marina TaxID=1644146 RepID=A0ABW4VT00_9BACT
MKNYSVIFLTILAIAVAIGCSSDDPEPDPIGNGGSNERCEDNPATLSGSVLAIINANCAISGCHVSGGQFPNFTIKANIIQNANSIRAQTESGNMPKASSGLTLSAKQKDDIFCWVANGAQDN